MFRVCFLVLVFFCLSCSNEVKPKYEYIVKNKSFIESTDLKPNTGFINLSRGVTFYKHDNKEASTVPIILIHGFSVPSYIWDPTFELLSNKGYNVISLDLFGRGFSENLDQPYTDKLFADQVIDLMIKLNIDSAKFVGLSNGGRVISKVAELKPTAVSSLIYVASSGFRSIQESKDKSVSNEEVENFIKVNYKKKINIFMVPQLLPITRGILSNVYVTLRKNITETSLKNIFIKVYKDKNFIKVLSSGLPSIKDVLNTNNCIIGIKKIKNTQTFMITSVIDNLLKGASGQAVQNMNLIFGFEENLGL